MILLLVLSTSLLKAQEALDLTPYSIQVESLEDAAFKSFMDKRLDNTQFVFVGEQHGIKEVGQFTNAVYNYAQAFDYKTLCVETDGVMANHLKSWASANNSLDLFSQANKDFTFSIPFYNNSDDIAMFKNVVSKKGAVWGIDQTFIGQFRFNFDYMIKTTSNKKLKAKLIPLKKKAEEAFQVALETKDFNAPYVYKYDKATHDDLMNTAKSDEEKEIIYQLWKTHEIYTYFNERKIYANNNVRGKLMKRNFMRYYRAAQKKTATPKVIFKLGANHAAKGLTRTSIYDISSLGSELAISNGMGSLHFIVMGISGQVAVGNPMSPEPIVSFDNAEQFPEEVQKAISSIDKKYYILDLVPLRASKYRRTLSDGFKDIVFSYDVIVLVKDAEALSGLK